MGAKQEDPNPWTNLPHSVHCSDCFRGLETIEFSFFSTSSTASLVRVPYPPIHTSNRTNQPAAAPLPPLPFICRVQNESRRDFFLLLLIANVACGGVFAVAVARRRRPGLAAFRGVQSEIKSRAKNSNSAAAQGDGCIFIV